MNTNLLDRIKSEGCMDFKSTFNCTTCLSNKTKICRESFVNSISSLALLQGKFVIQKKYILNKTDEELFLCLIESGLENDGKCYVSFLCDIKDLHNLWGNFRNFKSNFIFKEIKGKGIELIYSSNVEIVYLNLDYVNGVGEEYTIYSSEEIKGKSMWRVLKAMIDNDVQFVESGVNGSIIFIPSTELEYNPDNLEISYSYNDEYGTKKTVVMSALPDLCPSDKLAIAIRSSDSLNEFDGIIEPMNERVERDYQEWNLFSLDLSMLSPVLYTMNFFESTTFTESFLLDMEALSIMYLVKALCDIKCKNMDSDSIALRDYLRKVSENNDDGMNLNMLGCYNLLEDLVRFMDKPESAKGITKDILDYANINDELYYVKLYQVNRIISKMKLDLHKFRFTVHTYNSAVFSLVKNSYLRTGAVIV